MKFFGWGKSKDPQPQTVLQQVASKPVARSGAGSHGALDRSKSHSGMGSVMPPGKGGSTAGRPKQQGLFGVDEGGYLGESAPAAVVVEDDEEKLQDTIRFVFSHKREGLLAIGTFALEQLQSMRNTIDGSGQTVLPDVMQSSDDEDQLQRRWIAARKTCDLPVFGDTGGEEEEEDVVDSLKALTVYQQPERPVKPIVLLSPEVRRALDPKRMFLPHWTDAVPPPQVQLQAQLAKVPAPFVDEDYYSSRLCGLFSRKKSLKPHRRQGNEIVPVDGEDKKRIIPIELAAQDAKKSMLNFSAPSGVPTIGKLAKMWRASCKQSTARISPERKPSPVKELTPKDYPTICGVKNEAFGEVVTTPELQVMRPSSPKVECEFRRRVQMSEAPVELRGANRGDYGHWIKDDEDFVVLEM